VLRFGKTSAGLRTWSQRVLWLVLALWCASAPYSEAFAAGGWHIDETANGAPTDEQPKDGEPVGSPTGQSWVGAEGTANVWSIYSGTTWAPFGTIDESGWRVRIAGGYGQYKYHARIDGVRETVYGVASFGDLLAGYQMGLGDLTLKVFAGASFDFHLLTPFDPGNPVSDRVTGAKGAVEAWLNLGQNQWASFDLSYATAHASYYSRMRLGHRLAPSLSLGIEGGAFGNLSSDNGRAGGFVRYEWTGGEISMSGGVTGDIAKPSTPYATLVYLSKF
jgi:hypothetical protein